MNIRLKHFLFSILGLIAYPAMAQDPPVFSQFMANPYQFNPAYVAHNGYAEANVFYRKQWVGFDNAPEAAAVNIQAPFGRNVALGLQASSNKTVLLNTSAILGTFGYKVRLGHQSSLNFGLSAGVGFNNFKMEALNNSNDPVLTNIIPKSNALSSQFGLNLRVKKFDLGFSLPALLDPKTIERSESSPRFNPFANKFASVSYTATYRDISITPAVLYRALDNVQFQWEGMITARWKDVLSVGSSYRAGYGVTFFIGFELKKLLRIGYAYELPTGGISKAPNNATHEFHAGVRLGNRSREEDQLIRAAQSSKDENQVGVSEVEAGTEPDPTVAFPPDADNYTNAMPAPRSHYNAPSSTDHVPDTDALPESPVAEQPPNAGHYVVLGVYRDQNNALRQMGYLKQRGFVPSLLYMPEKSYYYVYVFHSTTREEAVRERKKTRRNNQFFGAWIYTID